MGSPVWASVQRAAGWGSCVIMTLCILSLVLVLLPNISLQACSYKGQQICDGAVTKEIGTKLLQVCVGTSLKYKKRSQVKPGYPLAGNDCEWYGEILCDGETVIDLYRWWFESHCSNKKMSVRARSWEEVVRDPRFKQRQ